MGDLSGARCAKVRPVLRNQSKPRGLLNEAMLKTCAVCGSKGAGTGKFIRHRADKKGRNCPTHLRPMMGSITELRLSSIETMAMPFS
jgi:hypothetical protein